MWYVCDKIAELAKLPNNIQQCAVLLEQMALTILPNSGKTVDDGATEISLIDRIIQQEQIPKHGRLLLH